MTKSPKQDERPQALPYRPVVVHPILQSQRKAHILSEIRKLEETAREGIIKGTIKPVSRGEAMKMTFTYLFNHLDDPECYKICKAWYELIAEDDSRKEASAQAIKEAMGPFAKEDQRGQRNFPDHEEKIDPLSMFRDEPQGKGNARL